MTSEKIKQLIKEGKREEINIMLEEIKLNTVIRNIEIGKIKYVCDYKRGE